MTTTTQAQATVTVSLEIENTYEDGTEIVTHVKDAVVPAPENLDDLTDWAQDNLFEFTGTDKYDGDAWYDVVITASSEPALVGETFDFGY